MSLFREGKTRLLVSTDMAARGLDVPEVRFAVKAPCRNRAWFSANSVLLQSGMRSSVLCHGCQQRSEQAAEVPNFTFFLLSQGSRCNLAECPILQLSWHPRPFPASRYKHMHCCISSCSAPEFPSVCSACLNCRASDLRGFWSPPPPPPPPSLLR